MRRKRRLQGIWTEGPGVPLVDKEREVIVLWSPKSACTTVYVWFSEICGFAQDVVEHGGFPHAHRMEVYRHSERFLSSIEADTSNFRVIKIIRDPYTRAASIFRQAILTGFADKDASYVGLDFKAGVSFRQFLLMVDRLDMETVNTHYRPQWHPLEQERRPDVTINISKSDLFAELNAIERRFDWPLTDFGKMDWLHALEASRKPPKMHGDDLFTMPIPRRERATKTPIPDYSALLAPEARGMIEETYRIDFEAYREFL